MLSTFVLLAAAATPSCGSDDGSSSGDRELDASADVRTDADSTTDASSDGASDAASANDATSDAPSSQDAADSDASDAAPDAPVLASGCRVVSCGVSDTQHACCAAVYSFAVNASSVSTPSLVGNFTSSDTSLVGEYQFTGAGQNGAIGMRLTSAQRPTYLKLTASVSGAAETRPFCTLETDGGASGCAYDLNASLVVDLATPKNCWGDMNFVPNRVSFRIKSTAAGNARLTITGIELR